MSELFWFKFVPKDFMGDMNVKRCSNEAIGVYIKFLCLAFESDESGVMISGGVPWSKDEILYAIGGPFESTQKAFDELLRWNLIKVRTEDGAYYNSRMVRDQEERSSTRDRVRKHRSVNGSKTNDVTPVETDNVTQSVTPSVTPTVTSDVTVQSIEYRVKSIENESIELERENHAQAREIPPPTPDSPPELKTKSGMAPNSHSDKSENAPPDSAPPPHGKPWNEPPNTRNGKPLIRDNVIMAEILQDQMFVEQCMMGSNVKTQQHLLECAEKYVLNERKKRDEDFVLMTRQEAMSGLRLWVKKEKPREANGLKVYDEKRSFSHAEREEQKFQKAAAMHHRREPGWNNP